MQQYAHPIDMGSVAHINTQQINVMSNQLFEQTARIAQLHERITILGTQLQSAQIHINAVDARMPSVSVVTNILRLLVEKLNEVITRTRGPSAEEARIMLDDLQAINMELAMSDVEKGAKKCDCGWNSLCDVCFDV